MSELKPFTFDELKKRFQGIPQGEQKQGHYRWTGKIPHLFKRGEPIARYMAKEEDILTGLDPTAESWVLYFYNGKLIDAKFLGFG